MTRRRKGGHGGGGGGGGGHGGGDSRWLVTYADLLTLLMVLFLVLWVISTIDLKKFEKFKSGLGDFGNPAAETANPTAGIGEDASTTTIEVTGTGPDAETTVPTEGTDAQPGGGSGDGSGSGGAMLDSGELGGLVNGLQSAIDAAGLDSSVTVSVDQRGLVITVTTDDVLFAPGSAELDPGAVAVIGAVAPALADIGNSVIVEGYTDRRPIRRQHYDNWDLSVDRAVTVVKLLRDSFGLAPSRMAATGYGDQHPVAEGDDEASFAKNRRVQIGVVAGAGQGGGAAAGAGGGGPGGGGGGWGVAGPGPGPPGTTSTAVSTATSSP